MDAWFIKHLLAGPDVPLGKASGNIRESREVFSGIIMSYAKSNKDDAITALLDDISKRLFFLISSCYLSHNRAARP